MERSSIRPLTVGQLLDRSLHLYRFLFSPLFFITLAAFGPFYLLSNLLLVNLGSLPLVPQFEFGDMERFWLSRFPEAWLSGGLEAWIKVLGMALLSLLLLFVVIPIYVSVCSILVYREIDGQPGTMGEAMRESFRRYGRVVGNSLLFWLIASGAYVGIIVVNGMLSLLYGGVFLSAAALSASGAVSTVAGGIFLAMYILFTYGGSLLYYYFFIRFGYFLPPVLFEGEGVGLGRSWSITRKNFWKLLAVYINFAVLMYSVSIALMIIFAGLGVSVAGLLLALLFFCAVGPAAIVLYVVSYRAQKARNDGDDVEALLRRLKGAES